MIRNINKIAKCVKKKLSFLEIRIFHENERKLVYLNNIIRRR